MAEPGTAPRLRAIQALIDRLASASAPDSELDEAIRDWLAASTGWQNSLVPHYTRSIDAALTLVPDGWSWRVGFDAGEFIAQLAEPTHTEFGAGIAIRSQVSDAPNPAIALCMAALHARAAIAKAEVRHG